VEGAIKLLSKVNAKAYARFRDKITIVNENSDMQGILPVLDYDLPRQANERTPWYVMPPALPLSEYLQNRQMQFIVRAVTSPANIMAQLHERGISHRDIKPSNLLVLNDSYYVGDFGLVHYPQKADLTQEWEAVGPKWTMAPEMRRNAANADGIPADVYSLAKTLWILLTKQSQSFDGQYTTSSINELKRYSPHVYTTPLDDLLHECTANDPSRRPSMREFSVRLREWAEMNRDFYLRNAMEWREIQERLFPTAIPKRVIWEDIDDIIKILNVLGSTDNLNHMFYPTGGGMDLLGAKLSIEAGCIELDAGLIDIVKPQVLIFESFGYDAEWNYFRLETADLEPSGVYENDDDHFSREEVLEIAPGYYVERVY